MLFWFTFIAFGLNIGRGPLNRCDERRLVEFLAYATGLRAAHSARFAKSGCCVCRSTNGFFFFFEFSYLCITPFEISVRGTMVI